jgi:hypothetical protein
MPEIEDKTGNGWKTIRVFISSTLCNMNVGDGLNNSNEQCFSLMNTRLQSEHVFVSGHTE